MFQLPRILGAVSLTRMSQADPAWGILGLGGIPSWNSPRLMAYAAFFFDVVVSIFSSRLNASRSLGRCR